MFYVDIFSSKNLDCFYRKKKKKNHLILTMNLKVCVILYYDKIEEHWAFFSKHRFRVRKSPWYVMSFKNSLMNRKCNEASAKSQKHNSDMENIIWFELRLEYWFFYSEGGEQPCWYGESVMQSLLFNLCEKFWQSLFWTVKHFMTILILLWKTDSCIL